MTRCVCSAPAERDGVRSELKAPAGRQVLDLFELQRGLIADARILVPPAHLLQSGIALGGVGVPMDTAPIRPHNPAEGIAGAQADADPVGLGAVRGGPAQILWVRDGAHW